MFIFRSQAQTVKTWKCKTYILQNIFKKFHIPLSFTDIKLSLKKLNLSENLPMPKDYSTRGENPILDCLLDQIKQDFMLSKTYRTQKTLLEDIISSLRNNEIIWPTNLMSPKKWIKKMRDNPKFYFYHAKNASEMQDYENVLLDLASKCLKRQINIIPFLELGQEERIFRPNDHHSSQSNELHFWLVSCQKLRRENFFFSVYKVQ